jgi:hypothetical protein
VQVPPHPCAVPGTVDAISMTRGEPTAVETVHIVGEPLPLANLNYFEKINLWVEH